jgi:hypothetical protein
MMNTGMTREELALKASISMRFVRVIRMDKG